MYVVFAFTGEAESEAIKEVLVITDLEERHNKANTEVSSKDADKKPFSNKKVVSEIAKKKAKRLCHKSTLSCDNREWLLWWCERGSGSQLTMWKQRYTNLLIKLDLSGSTIRNLRYKNEKLILEWSVLIRRTKHYENVELDKIRSEYSRLTTQTALGKSVEWFSLTPSHCSVPDSQWRKQEAWRDACGGVL